MSAAVVAEHEQKNKTLVVPCDTWIVSRPLHSNANTLIFSDRLQHTLESPTERTK